MSMCSPLKFALYHKRLTALSILDFRAIPLRNFCCTFTKIWTSSPYIGHFKVILQERQVPWQCLLYLSFVLSSERIKINNEEDNLQERDRFILKLYVFDAGIYHRASTFLHFFELWKLSRTVSIMRLIKHGQQSERDPWRRWNSHIDV